MKLPFAYHVNQLNTAQERPCPAKRFEPQHLSYPAFDVTVILLNQSIERSLGGGIAPLLSISPW